jgi:hypothetical protein
MTVRQPYVLATTAIFQEQSLRLPKPRRGSWYIVLCVNVLISCDVLEYVDVVGQTRDLRRVCGAIG